MLNRADTTEEPPVRSEQISWSEAGGWTRSAEAVADAGLVFYFGRRETLADGSRYRELASLFPGAHVLGCSTGGQITGADVTDDGVAALAIAFGETPVRAVSRPFADGSRSYDCGLEIGRSLAAPDLAGVFVLSDGLSVNGSRLVAGLTAALGASVPLTGGLAGDSERFAETIVGLDGPPTRNLVAAVGFYGDAVRIGHGSAGGWDVFGPRRRITRSEGSILYELDDEPALDLYERYLGPEEADGLPGTALLFPLQIFDPARPHHVIVRTVLAVDRGARSMNFAGDLPEGWTAQLMRGNFDRLASGAGDAARQALTRSAGGSAAILVSCIGRRLLMGQRIVDELEAVGTETRGIVPIGFYSYGEIAPHAVSGFCELHNQTMTVTTIAEGQAA